MELEFKFITNANPTPRVKSEHIIVALINDQQLGYLRFEECENLDLTYINYDSEEVLPRAIYLAYISVDNNRQGEGIAKMLLREFGNLYSKSFSGLPVVHLFTNPVAEYLYRKMVAQGDIPVEAYQEQYFFKDDMQDEFSELWVNLNSKLPKGFKGKNIDWNYEALYGGQ